MSPDDDGFSAIGPYLGHLKTEAIRAIARLVKGTVAQPIVREMQEAENLAHARSIFSKGLAEAALEEAKGDRALVRRYMHRIAAEGLVQQENREAIAGLAAKELARHEEGNVDTPEADWLARFTRYAEAVSDLDMQRLWARVLAGEISRPGRFSLRALRHLSELDRPTALLFTSHLSSVIGNEAMIFPMEGLTSAALEELSLLEEAGLITSVMDHRDIRLGQDDNHEWVYEGREFRLVFVGSRKTDSTFPIQIMPLSKVGQELLNLVEMPSELPALQIVASVGVRHLDNPPFVRVSAAIFPKDAVGHSSEAKKDTKPIWLHPPA